MEQSNEWITIESDPGVFSGLVQAFGAKNIQVEELYSLDDSALEALSLTDIYGLIFLFKWGSKDDERQVVNAEFLPDLFFAKQVVTNSCATQALLSILLNCAAIETGEQLQEFKSFTTSFEPYMKGLAIGNCEHLRACHNSYAKGQSALLIEQDGSSDKGDAFHYVSYVPHNNKIYELDGLKSGPIEVGEFDTENKWAQAALPEIRRRISQLQSKKRKADGQEQEDTDIRFNLLAVVGDRTQMAQQKISAAKQMVQKTEIKLVSLGEDLELTEMDEDMEIDDGAMDSLPNEVAALQALRLQHQSNIEEYSEVLEQEKQKFTNYAAENARRQHDWIPFTLCLLSQAARLHKLEISVK
eukprot:Platyproteum_vivax@DN7191_c0_g1_i3.p1